MKSKSNLTLIILLLIFFSCKNNHSVSNYEKETRIFNKYLKDVFSETIPLEKRIFVILPCIGCEGCISSIIKKVDNCTVSLDSFNISLVTTNETFLKYSSSLVGCKNLLVDKKGSICEYEFGYGYPSIYQTKNGEITNIFILSPEKINKSLPSLNCE